MYLTVVTLTTGGLGNRIELLSRAVPSKARFGGQASRYSVSVVVGNVGEDGLPSELPLLEGRDRLNGAATAYVCENYVCQLPTGDPAILAEQLA